jgi:RsiW-degrading membrane proteinase PrsW (M82 family)
MAILIASLAPVLIILLYIYLRDKYEREPLWLLFKLVVGGALVVIPIALVEQALVAWMPPFRQIGAAAYHAFVVAGITEEGFKFLVLYLIAWNSRWFNEKFDGIVYAVFVSLGFAAVENIMYVVQSGYQTALVRALTAVPAHALFGVAMGYYFGIARMYEEIRSKYLLKAILVPVILHGIYDFILMVGIGWLLMLFIPYVVYLYMAGMRKIRILSDASIYKPPEEES